MDLVQQFLNFLDRTADSTSMRELGDALNRLAGEYGYGETIVVDAHKMHLAIGRALLFASKSTSTVVRDDRAFPLAGHARYKWSEENDTPASFDDIRKSSGITHDAWDKSMSPDAQEMMGLVVPVHHKNGLEWYMQCEGRKPSQTPLTAAVMHAAAIIAHDRYALGTLQRESSNALTRQQAACMRWIEEGKTDAEISTIMGIAPRTVRFHVSIAKKKLGVKTRMQAVVATKRRKTSVNDHKAS